MASRNGKSAAPDIEEPDMAEDVSASYFWVSGPLASYLRNIEIDIDKRSVLGQGIDLYKRLFQVLAGSSEIAPDKRDWRFQDEAWTKNPVYRRLSQAYLAISEAVEKMIPDDLPIEQKARRQLVTSIVMSTLAPTNTLIGNPAAIAKTIETRGGNLVRGLSALVRDLKENGGMPRQVDDSGFEVGRNLAVTPGKVVHRGEMFELIHYQPATREVHQTPVLLIPPQIGRFYFTDLAPGRSFAEYTVSQGLQYFAISWRNASPEESEWSLEDYVEAALEAVEAVAAITRQPKINLVGFCAGGILATIVIGYLKATGRDLVNTLTLCVTMLDFKTDASLGAFRFPALLSVAKAQSAAKGVLPGTELHKIFSWLRPNDLIWNYWVNNYLMGEEPPAFDILAWNKDSTNLPARLHEDFLDLFEENSLIEPGGYKAMDLPIELGAIDCDNFVVGAVTDHLTPWKACYEARRHLGGDSTFALSNGGHVAALVNPPGSPKAHHWVGPASAPDGDSWLEQTPKLTGSWWESWTQWCRERSGEMTPAPTVLGSAQFLPIVDAPGEYVRS